MNSLTFSELIRFVSIFSVTIPLLVYLRKIKNVTIEIHIIGAITIVSLLSDIIGFVLVSRRMPTAILSNTYFIVTFVLLSCFYYRLLFMKAYRALFIVATVFYLGLFLAVSFFFQSFLQNQSIVWSLTGVVFIFYGVAYFKNLVVTLHVTPYPPDYSSIWINNGVLFYFAFNLFLFLVSNYVLSQLEPDIASLVWSFHNVNNTIKNFLFAIGIALHKK